MRMVATRYYFSQFQFFTVSMDYMRDIGSKCRLHSNISWVTLADFSKSLCMFDLLIAYLINTDIGNNSSSIRFVRSKFRRFSVQLTMPVMDPYITQRSECPIQIRYWEYMMPSRSHSWEQSLELLLLVSCDQDGSKASEEDRQGHKKNQ